MALLEINRDPSPREVRQFGFYWLPGFFLILAVLAVHRFASWPAAVAMVVCAVLSIVGTIVQPRVAAPSSSAGCARRFRSAGSCRMR